MVIRLVFFSVLALLAVGGSTAAYRLVASPHSRDEHPALAAAHDPRAMQATLRRLVRTEPRNAEAHVQLARTQLMLNDPVAAEKELKLARTLRYDRAVLNPLLAQAYLRQEHYADVLIDMPGAAARTEEMLPNLVARSLAFLAQGSLVDAEACLDQALRLAPVDDAAGLAQARIALARSRPDAAKAAVGPVLARSPDLVEALLLMGTVLTRLNETEAAIDVLGRAIANAPYSIEARLQRADLNMQLGRDRAAQEDVDASLAVDWRDSAALITRAILMVRASRLAEAATEFQKLSPVMDRFPRAAYYQALTASLQDQTASALDMAERYLRLQPGDADGLNLAASLTLKLGYAGRAVELLEKPVRGGAGNAATFDLLGRSYFTTGRTQEAVDSFRRAAALEPGNPAFAAHLAAAQTPFGAAPTLEASRDVAAERTHLER